MFFYTYVGVQGEKFNTGCVTWVQPNEVNHQSADFGEKKKLEKK